MPHAAHPSSCIWLFSIVLLTLPSAHGRSEPATPLVPLVPRIQSVPPYPPSNVITGMSFSRASRKHLALGSDNWPVTWADDGHVYGAWGDGGGFGSSGTGGADRVSLGFARIEGTGTSYVGINRWGGKNHEFPAQFEGKSFGIVSIDSMMYAWVSPLSGPTTLTEARLAYSNDHSAHWTRIDWALTLQDSLVLPTFLNFGRGYAGARDEYVYTYLTELKNASDLQIQFPGEIALARVPKTEVLLRDSWEFFAGLDAYADPTWSTEMDDRRPVFEDANGVGWTSSVSFNAGIGRYILCTEHDSSGVGNLGMFEAPEPWGPWKTAAYVSSWEDYGHVFYWNFANKWVSADGASFTMVYSGYMSEDAWQTVLGSFQISVPPVGVAAPPHARELRLTARQRGDVLVFGLATPASADGTALRLDLYDVAGRHVARILRGTAATGYREISWPLQAPSGTRLGPSVYYARLSAGPSSARSSGILVR